MHTVNMLQAKSSLSRLVEDIEMGRASEIIIARNGRPAAKLVPLDSSNAPGPRLGVAKGLFEVPDSIDELNDEVAKLFPWGATRLNLLLDTHVALWAITDSPKLSQTARDLLQSPKATLWVSTVSVWEISIKHSLGKAGMPISGSQALIHFRESGYRLLPIEAEHVVAVETLPSHHQDPFDRILVAQALMEPMRLVTHDAVVALYSDTIIKI